MKNLSRFLLPGTLAVLILLCLAASSFAAATWSAKGPAGAGVKIEKLFIDPVNPSKIYAFAPENFEGTDIYSIFFSFNSGESWEKISPELDLYPTYLLRVISDLKFIPADTRVSFMHGFWQEYDGGWGSPLQGIFKNDYYLQPKWSVNYEGYQWSYGTLAIHPVSPEVMYAASDPQSAYFGAPILIMTTDEGASWQTKQNQILVPEGGSLGITGLAISKNDTRKIILHMRTHITPSTSEGFYKSTNEGESLTLVYPTAQEWSNFSFTRLAVRKGSYPAGEVNTYAFELRGSFTNSWYYLSTNEGDSWERKRYPEFNRPWAVSVSDSDFKTVYLVVGPSFNYTLYKSTDGGVSWSQLPKTGLPNTYANDIAVDPLNSSTIYLATNSGIYRSINGGSSWQGINEGIGSGKIRALTISEKEPSKIFIATAASPSNLIKSGNYAETWNSPLTNLRNAQKISFDQRATGTLYSLAALGSQGLFRSTNEGVSWTRITPDLITGESPWSGSTFAVSEATREIFFQTRIITQYPTVEGGRLLKSDDGGDSFVEINALETEEAGTIVVTDPISKEIIYIGGNIPTMNGLRKSVDGGTSFADITETGMAYVNDIAIDPTDNMILYAACGSPEGAGGLWRSSDGGGSFSEVGPPAIGYVKQVEISRSSPNIVYVSLLTSEATGNGVFKSSNSGGSWTKISGTGLEDSRPVYFLSVDPQSHVLVYAGTSNGVYKGFVDVPAPSVESIAPSSGSQFYPMAVTIGGNYFFNISRVYLSKGATTWDLAVSSYTPISIEAIIPAGADPGTYEVKVTSSAYGTSGVGPTFEVFSADVDGPIISKVKFDGRFYYQNAPISRTPLVTCTATDEDGVSSESFSFLLYNLTDNSIRSIPAPQGIPSSTEVSFSYRVGSGGEPRLSDGLYQMYLSARDLVTPESNVGVWVGNIKVYGGDVKTIGDVLAYPTPFKPLSGPSLRIAYNLSQNASVTMFIYDISGKVIATKKYSSGSQGGHAGYNEITWDGKTDFGRMAPNGIVVIKITAGNRAIGTLKVPVID